MTRRRILYVTHRVPHPPDKGDRIRNFHVLQFLADRADVDLASLADEPVSQQSMSALELRTKRLAIVSNGGSARWVRAGWSLASGHTLSEGVFESPRLRQVLRDWRRHVAYDAAVFSASSLAPYARELNETPVVVDLVDVDSQKWLDFARQSSPPKSWIYQREGARLRQLERSIGEWARAVTLVSETESELLRSFSPAGNVVTATNGVDLDYFSPSAASDSLQCVFVGALDYKPNADGIIWFVETAWAAIKKKAPSATLAIVGRQPSAAVMGLSEFDGVRVAGSVPDVRPFIRESRLCVVPLRIARGLQNKILEGMAMSRPVVTSRLPLQSLAAQPGRDLLVADEPEEWVTEVVRLLKEPSLASTIGAAARRYVEAAHRWDTTLRPFASILGLPMEAPEKLEALGGRTLEPD